MGALNVVKKFMPKVVKVVDAKKNAKIEVTLQDASSKKVKDHSACALAVACKRKFHLDGVIISRSAAYLIKGNVATRYRLSGSAGMEVVSFDRGAGFAPGEYELGAVSPSNRMGVRVGRTLDPSRNRSGEDVKKKFRHVTSGIRAVLGGRKPKDL